jgi:arylsulfatase A
MSKAPRVFVNRWVPILLLIVVCLAQAAHSAVDFGSDDDQHAAPPMNIILILGDDLGAETVSVYGGESYQTPHLDQLAIQGIRFDYAHAQPLCTPSRVKIMTGQYNFRNYHHFGYLDPTQTTFAHILKDAGYSTAVAGKWQLFNNRFEDIQGSTPQNAGFEEFLLWQMNVEQAGPRFWGPLLNYNGELRQHQQSVFGPDVFNDYVLDYIETHKDQPFFIYYPMVLVHDPWVTTPDMLDNTASDQHKFAAMMAYMDKMVGKVRQKVEQEGIADRTLILYIGDNGTGRDIVSRRNGNDVRGAKSQTINAGSQVPFMVWGPGLVQSGVVSDSLVNLNDILPTLAEIAGVEVPVDYPGDGESLAPLLRGEGELDRENIFIHYEPRWPSGLPSRYAFDRRWKLYEGGGFFDMASDPLESTALPVEQLSGEAAIAYQALSARIERMPGELQSTRRWIPAQFYVAAAVAVLILISVGYLLWRLIRTVRRSRRSTN